MDPNDPRQAPGAPSPYGAPPASPYGAPPASPYGAPPPAWGAPAPIAPARSRFPRRLIVAVVVIIVVVAIGAGLAVLNSDDGKVQFSKTAYEQSKTTCHMDNAITTANVGDTIYMIAAFKDTLDAGQSFTMTVTKDGQNYGAPIPATLPNKFNCYMEQGSIKPSDPGVYKFTFTKDGKTESEGTLTVK